MRNTSSAVTMTPISSGMPNSSFEADGRADDFGKVGGADRHFGQQPEAEADRPGIGVAAGLREVAPGGDRQSRAKCCSTIAMMFDTSATTSSV